MKKKLAILGIATFSVLGLCLSASAAALTDEEREQRKTERIENREDRKAQIEERKEERKEKKEEIKEKRCENAGKRIQTRIQRYENKQKQHGVVFGKLVTRIEAVAEKLEAKGVDTTKLTSDVETLKEKIKELETEHESFISSLEATENYECGSSDGQFREKLGESRKMSAEVRAKLVDVRNYYQTVVRVDIIELRDQLEDDNSESSVE